jgi:hypothetical protein
MVNQSRVLSKNAVISTQQVQCTLDATTKPFSDQQLFLGCGRQVGVLQNILQYERVNQVFQNPDKARVGSVESRPVRVFEEPLNFRVIFFQRFTAWRQLPGNRMDGPVDTARNVKHG